MQNAKFVQLFWENVSRNYTTVTVSHDNMSWRYNTTRQTFEFFSYEQLIALVTERPGDGGWTLTIVEGPRSSVTTTRHRNLLKRYLPSRVFYERTLQYNDPQLRAEKEGVEECC